MTVVTRAGALLEKVAWGRGKKRHQTYLELLGDCADLFMEKLGIPASTKVKITFQKMPIQQMGYLVLEPGKTNNFDLFLNAESTLYYWVRGMAHELTHLAQVLRGDLEYLGDGGLLWQGEHYPDYLKGGVSTPEAHAKYASLPWEAEAIGNEKPFHAEAKKRLDRPVPSLAALGIDGNFFD